MSDSNTPFAMLPQEQPGDEAAREERHQLLATLLGAFADGELPAETVSQIDAHLLGCARCRREVQVHRVLRMRLEQEPITAAPSSLRDRIAAAVENAPVPALQLGYLRRRGPHRAERESAVALVAGQSPSRWCSQLLRARASSGNRGCRRRVKVVDMSAQPLVRGVVGRQPSRFRRRLPRLGHRSTSRRFGWRCRPRCRRSTTRSFVYSRRGPPPSTRSPRRCSRIVGTTTSCSSSFSCPIDSFTGSPKCARRSRRAAPSLPSTATCAWWLGRSAQRGRS